jgi:uncharacterized DUF497 family protein
LELSFGSEVQYNFDWDPAKARENLRKHGISFERAAQVFLDPSAISIYDEEHSDEEDRWVTLAKDKNETLLVVIHTFRELDSGHCSIRLISARRATRREGRQFAVR